MKDLPDEKTLAELVELGQSFEHQARKLYEMAEAFAQKYEKRLDEVKLAQAQKQGLEEAQVPAEKRRYG